MFLHLWKRSPVALIIMPALLSTIWAQAPTTTETASLRAETSQHSIATGKETGLTFQTTHGASCIFHSENYTDTHHQLRLDYVNQDVVLVYARSNTVSSASSNE